MTFIQPASVATKKAIKVRDEKLAAEESKLVSGQHLDRVVARVIPIVNDAIMKAADSGQFSCSIPLTSEWTNAREILAAKAIVKELENAGYLVMANVGGSFTHIVMWPSTKEV